jgi:predicted metal-dependent hydrolase
LRVFLKSARAAARGAKRLRNTGKAARRGQVVRVFLRSGTQWRKPDYAPESANTITEH